MAQTITIAKLELTQPERLYVQICTAPGMLRLLTIPEAAAELGMDARTLQVHLDNRELVPVHTGERNIPRLPMWQLLLWQIGKQAVVPQLCYQLTKQFSIEYNPAGHALLKIDEKQRARKAG